MRRSAAGRPGPRRPAAWPTRALILALAATAAPSTGSAMAEAPAAPLAVGSDAAQATEVNEARPTDLIRDLRVIWERLLAELLGPEPEIELAEDPQDPTDVSTDTALPRLTQASQRSEAPAAQSAEALLPTAPTHSTPAAPTAASGTGGGQVVVAGSSGGGGGGGSTSLPSFGGGGGGSGGGGGGGGGASAPPQPTPTTQQPSPPSSPSPATPDVPTEPAAQAVPDDPTPTTPSQPTTPAPAPPAAEEPQDTPTDEQPAQEAEAPAPEFPFFDGTLFAGKPELAQAHGFPPIRIIYPTELWDEGESMHEPNESRLREVARRVPAGETVCLNIEHWSLRNTTPEKAEASLRKYLRVLEVFREENPDVKLGFYRLVPPMEFTAVPELVRRGMRWRYDRYLKEIEFVRPLGEAVDVLFPSAYTLHEDPEGWEMSVVETIKQARQFGKPVYPFLWPRYHNMNSRVGMEPLPDAVWARQLEVVRSYADGAVIWGGWIPGVGRRQWDDNAPWFRETLRQLALPRPSVMRD